MTYPLKFRHKVLGVRAREGLTIAQVAARFGLSQRGIGEILRRLGVTYKKTLSHPKASKQGRRAFLSRIKAHEAAGRRIVTIDQSGFASDMPRSHGDAVKGRRCFGTHA